ncbi:MAG TPA: M23 family metallopeptidase [Candidatus Hydrogenedentes bacterium]|nr:M23 family metallopeptidase [Candidatus Hydrogenedentota bacterium]
MRKWTVMLIPHDRGTTRSLNLHALQLWVVAALFVGLSFMAAFLFRRHQILSRRVADLRTLNLHLEERLGARLASDVFAPKDGSDEAAAEVEQMRADFETSKDVMAAELTRVYDLENEVRQVYGLPPRVPPAELGLGGGGKGGPPGELDSAPDSAREVGSPAHAIYGLWRPSADLIIKEARIRAGSLTELLAAMEVRREGLERTPSIWPINHPERRITSPFGRRRDPFNRAKWDSHNGTDIGAPYGSSVMATAKGEVVSSRWESYYGNIVKIDHGNGIETWYAHLSKRLVREGERVERGHVVGKLGGSGRVTGPHLHYEVRVNGKPVDVEERYLGN